MGNLQSVLIIVVDIMHVPRTIQTQSIRFPFPNLQGDQDICSRMLPRPCSGIILNVEIMLFCFVIDLRRAHKDRPSDE